MKIYLVHSTSYDFKVELYQPIKKSALVTEHSVEFLFDREEIPKTTKDIIENSDLILAEVSYPSLGEGYELGLADMFKVPILCFHKKGQIGSKFVNMISANIFEYTDSEDMIKKLEQNILKINSK